MQSQDAKLTIRVEINDVEKAQTRDEFVPVNIFLAAVKHLQDAAVEIARVQGYDAADINWVIVGMKLGSATVDISPSSRNVSVIDSITQTFDRVEKGIAGYEVPRKALSSLRDASRLTNDRVKVSVGFDDRLINITEGTKQTTNRLLNSTYVARGALFGRLYHVSLNDRAEFGIRDPNGNPVRCYFSDDYFPDVKQALGENVTVRGLITYQLTGRPTSITLETLEVIEPVPYVDLKDAVGIWKMDVSAEDYVRRLRDEN